MVTTEQHLTIARGLLVQQFKDQPLIEALLDAIVRPAQPIEDALQELLVERSVDTAEGVQLDALGAIVGVDRAGLTDEPYRSRIRARVAANKSSGLINELLIIALLVVADASATVEFVPDYPGAGRLVVSGAVPSDDTAAAAVALAQEAAAAGVRILVEYLTDTEAETLTFPATVTLNGAEGSGGPKTIAVNGSTAKFPASGTFTIDAALAVEENAVSYTGKTASSLLGVTFASAHADKAIITSEDTPGKGYGDDGVPATGGVWASVKEAPPFVIPSAVTYPATSRLFWESYGITPPAYVYDCQDSSAPALQALGTGAHPLSVVTGTPDFAQTAESRLGISFQSGEQIAVADTSFLDIPAGQNFSWWIRAFVPDGTGATDQFPYLGKADVFGAGWFMWIPHTSGRPSCFFHDGTNNPVVSMTTDHRDGWHNFVGVLDRTNSQNRFQTDLQDRTTVIGTLNAITNSAPFRLGAVSGETPQGGETISYVAIWPDYALTDAEQNTLANVTP